MDGDLPRSLLDGVGHERVQPETRWEDGGAAKIPRSVASKRRGGRSVERTSSAVRTLEAGTSGSAWPIWRCIAEARGMESVPGAPRGSRYSHETTERPGVGARVSGSLRGEAGFLPAPAIRRPRAPRVRLASVPYRRVRCIRGAGMCWHSEEFDSSNNSAVVMITIPAL